MKPFTLGILVGGTAVLVGIVFGYALREAARDYENRTARTALADALDEMNKHPLPRNKPVTPADVLPKA